MKNFCINCGHSLISDSNYCSACGQRIPRTDPENSYLPPEKFQSAPQKKEAWFTNLSPTRKILLVVIAVVSFLAAINGQNILSYVVGTAQGQTSLDVTKVEQSITDGIAEQTGESVVVICPSVMLGKVGDIFKCEVVDELDSHYFADVTIQNSKGDVVWQLVN